MDDDLHTIKRDGWVWRVKYPESLTPWLGDYRIHMRENEVKRNDLRVTFKVTTPIGSCYVKHDNPKAGLTALRSRFISKAKSEFRSARLLMDRGINVVEYLGWGRKGREGMLISRELRGALNARDYWFSTASATEEGRKDFLDKFAVFLVKLFRSGLYHPDLHLGNLLLEPERFRFVVVDPYGVRKMNVPTVPLLFRMWSVIGALRGEITDVEAFDLILRSGMTPDPREAIRIWADILDREAREMRKLWPKRRRQVLSGNSKYTRTIDQDGVAYLVRTTMSGNSWLNSSNLNMLEKDFEVVPMKSVSAKRAWLNSFSLQFHRITHRRPIAWRRGKDEALVYETIKKAEEPSPAEAEEFVKRCEIVGFQPDPSQLRKNAETNRVFLVDSKALQLYKL